MAELFRIINFERIDYEYKVCERHARVCARAHCTALRGRFGPSVPLQVRVTLFEIYNEQVRDLLVDPKLQATPPWPLKLGRQCRCAIGVRPADVIATTIRRCSSRAIDSTA